MHLDDLFANLHQLPNVPKVAQDLIVQFDNPNTSIEAVARNIACDPVISAFLLPVSVDCWPSRLGLMLKPRLPAACSTALVNC